MSFSWVQEGVAESGVTLAFTVRAMDAGPIVAQQIVNMDQYADADEALQDLFQLGARCAYHPCRPASILPMTNIHIFHEDKNNCFWLAA